MRQCKGRKAGREGLDRRKVVAGGTGRLNTGPAAELSGAGRQLVVEERGVIDGIPAADHDVPDAAEQVVRRVGKANARSKILEVGLGAGGAVAVDESTGNGGRNGNSGVPVVGKGEIQSGHSIVSLV